MLEQFWAALGMPGPLSPVRRFWLDHVFADERVGPGLDDLCELEPDFCRSVRSCGGGAGLGLGSHSPS